MDSIFSMSIDFLNSQQHFLWKCTDIGKEKIDSEKLYDVLCKKIVYFSLFSFPLFSKYAANAPKDKINTTKTEKKNKMIEL